MSLYYPGIVVLLIQLAFAAHVFRSGRSYLWILPIMFLPLIGCVAYLIFAMLPDAARSDSARRFADDVVNSARVGIAKPDPRILELAAARAGVRPERCLFVDDGPENVEAAAALGMRAVRYRGPADLEEALQPLF